VSGEELLVAGAASSYAATLTALAERRGLQVASLEVEGLGLVERRPSGRFEFVGIELAVTFPADLSDRDLRALAEDARERALVASALGVPLHVRLVRRPAVAGGVRGPGPGVAA
jgi:organic hydroperoxide reductase OsmC/OhrA